MSDAPKKRPLFQIHLSTAIVLMFVAGGLVWWHISHPLKWFPACWGYADLNARILDFGGIILVTAILCELNWWNVGRFGAVKGTVNTIVMSSVGILLAVSALVLCLVVGIAASSGVYYLFGLKGIGMVIVGCSVSAACVACAMVGVRRLQQRFAERWLK